MFKMVDSILEGDGTSALRGINRLIEDGRDISVFVKDITGHMRNLLIIKTCDKNFAGLIDASPTTLSAYEKQAEKAGRMRTFRAVEMFVELESELKWASQPRVLLELTIARLCRPEEEKSYEAILDRLETIEKKLSDIDTGSFISSASKSKIVQPNEVAPTLQKEKKDEPAQKVKGDIADIAPDKPGDDLPETSEEDGRKDVDVAKMWPQILKMIKKERVAIYSLLMDAQLKHKGGNVATLIFPPDQGFYVTAIEKEDNRKFIEEMILKATGKEMKMKCLLEGQNTEPSHEGDMVVKKAIEIFGKDHIQVVDEE